ncbi:hypothetical protein [Acetobacterium tundrae]|uniref:HK97 gp10 family phage protein n=1 Tax=Acetobacterium tundrae TaxID=132932 RepID=A0ABR6WNL9_9FIRM|nr:hypothetical protein [Acetobacterium tundrae]MBC3798031.1 hypothetical protein [Acetobacterium tundrae]
MTTKIKIQISPDELANNIKLSTRDIEKDIRDQVRQRAQNQVPIEIRNATIVVLAGKRSGRRYGKHIASAPGEAPAVKSNTLRLSHLPYQHTVEGNNGMTIVSGAETNVKYAATLEDGFDGMVKARRGKNKKYVSYHLKIAPRPYVEQSKKKALNKIKELYREAYR